MAKEARKLSKAALDRLQAKAKADPGRRLPAGASLMRRFILTVITLIVLPLAACREAADLPEHAGPATEELGDSPVARDLQDPAKRLYGRGMAETRRMLREADTDEQREAAFDFLVEFLEENDDQLRSRDYEVHGEVRHDVMTLQYFLDRFAHERFDEEACKWHRNHVRFLLRIEDVDIDSLEGAAKELLELYDLACDGP